MSHMRNRLVPNEWPWPLFNFRGRIKVMSTIALHNFYIRRWISRKLLEIEAWFQRTTNTKWHMGYQMVTWPMMLRDLERSNSWPLKHSISKTAWDAIYGVFSNNHKFLDSLLRGSTVGCPSLASFVYRIFTFSTLGFCAILGFFF